MDDQKTEDFYKNWIERLPRLANGYIYGGDKNLLPTRYIFCELKKLLGKFLTNNLGEYEKIILLPGIRGVGKTTLLLQLFKIEKFLKGDDETLLVNRSQLEEIFYLDTSKLRLEGISLNDFFKHYEKMKDFSFEDLSRKYLLLLDEVHYDEDWGLFLKNMFDRTKAHKNILVIATGSSAINIRMNPDLSRRATVMDIYPMKFNEYLILKYNKYPEGNLSESIQDAVFDSSNAKEVYQSLRNRNTQVDRFFMNLPSDIEQDFFKTGNFPSSVNITDEIKSLESIKNVINNIIIRDLITLKRFKTQTIAKVTDLLYLLANSDLISYEKLRASLKIERFETVESLIEVLIMSGILVKIKTYSKTYGGTRKTPKLLFIAPSLRTAVLDDVFQPGIEGKKLEDYFVLYYMKDLRNRLAVDISYDIAEGGADFILVLKNRSKIVIEIGFNKEEISQVVNTQRKIKSKYGIVFGGKNLELANDSIVKIPLKYLLMI